MQHHWVASLGGVNPVVLTGVARSAGHLLQRRKFKKAAHAVIAVNRMGSPSETDNLVRLL